MEGQPKDLINIVHNIDKNLGVLIQKTDDYASANTKEHECMTTELKEHNGRLKKLEKWRAGFMGGFLVVLFLLGWMFDFLKDKF